MKHCTCRRETNKLAMKQKRLCETNDETLCRRESDRLATKQKRAHVNSNIDNTITLFTSKVQCCPEYVCTVCQRMLYKSSVIVFNESKYNNESDVLKSVLNEKYRHVSDDSQEWICKSCHNAMCRNNVPVQAKVNGLELAHIPNELKDLNTLELRMISLRIPFMKLLALPSGRQCCIHGPAVNVPSKLDSVCTLLPRLPNEASMIPLKLKRKLRYKGHYMYDYLRPDKVMMTLKWLKANNP